MPSSKQVVFCDKMWVYQQKSRDSHTKRKVDSVEEMKRRFMFSSIIYGKLGKRATLTAEYRVLLWRTPGDEWTRILVRPDFGPQKGIRIKDCGITWKSIFYAYKWCSRHAHDHLKTWVGMDLEENERLYGMGDSGAPVIPDKQLSTGQE